MSERKKIKKKGKGKDDEDEKIGDKPNKVEYKVANYMKSKLPPKKTKFLNHQVSYFNGNKAIDLLLDSSWATGSSPLFTDRASVVEYGNKLLQHKFFHRAKKIAVTDKDLTPKELKRKKEKENSKEEKNKEKENSKEEKNKESKNKDKKKAETEEDQDGTEKTDEASNEKEKLIKEKDKNVKEKEAKKKTKIKLDMHLEQVFVDGSDAYIWMYDPIPFWYYIAGGLMLFSAVAICLFPLWPPYVRQGVYYLSMAAASFLGLIFGLTIVRFVFFCFIWVLSLGRHHFWMLPNLTEDVGFFASFWPLYHYEYRGDAYDKKRKSKKKRSSDQESDNGLRETSDKEGGHNDNQSALDTDKPETDGERNVGASGASGQDATDSENSHSENSNSQTFEMVDKDDLPEQNDLDD